MTERWRYYEQLAAMQRTVPEVASTSSPMSTPMRGTATTRRSSDD